MSAGFRLFRWSATAGLLLIALGRFWSFCWHFPMRNTQFFDYDVEPHLAWPHEAQTLISWGLLLVALAFLFACTALARGLVALSQRCLVAILKFEG